MVDNVITDISAMLYNYQQSAFQDIGQASERKNGPKDINKFTFCLSNCGLCFYIKHNCTEGVEKRHFTSLVFLPSQFPLITLLIIFTKWAI